MLALKGWCGGGQQSWFKVWWIISKLQKGSEKNEEIESLNLPSVVTLAGVCASISASVCIPFVSFWTSELALCVSLRECAYAHVLSRRWDHELKRRLMSQDMEAQTPICSLPHSGGCLSPQNPILSANTHTHTHMYTLLRHSRKAKDSGLCVYVWQREHMFRKV